MQFTKKQKVAAALAGGAMAVAGGGVAFAYWTASGTGTGTASTSTSNNTGLTFSTSALNAMYPGDSSQAFTVTVTNNNTASKAEVTGVSAYLTVAPLAGKTCDASNYLLDGTDASTYTSSSPKALAWSDTTLDKSGASSADHASTAGTDSIQFNDKDSNQDGCKGATVTLHYAVAAS